jgi:hypothetical protein
MFEMHRIFCATPWELEGERRCFHELVGNFNETRAMAEGILFVPVSLVNTRDKRPLQYVIEENIRDCRAYLLVLLEDWGPPERNFRRDFGVALQAAADPALPMREVAVIAKEEPFAGPPAPGLPEPQTRFHTMVEFDECVTNLLSGWFESLRPQAPVRAATA